MTNNFLIILKGLQKIIELEFSHVEGLDYRDDRVQRLQVMQVIAEQLVTAYHDYQQAVKESK